MHMYKHTQTLHVRSIVAYTCNTHGLNVACTHYIIVHMCIILFINGVVVRTHIYMHVCIYTHDTCIIHGIIEAKGSVVC